MGHPQKYFIKFRQVNDYIYHKVWLLGACAYIFRRNVLLNLPYLLRASAYKEYC